MDKKRGSETMSLFSFLQKEIMITPYQNKYFLIIIATALITVAQMTFMEVPYTLLNFLYIFITQIIAPVFFASIILIILWYTGKHMKPSTIFYTYFFTWVINLLISFYIIFTGSYEAYLITKIISL